MSTVFLICMFKGIGRFTHFLHLIGQIKIHHTAQFHVNPDFVNQFRIHGEDYRSSTLSYCRLLNKRNNTIALSKKDDNNDDEPIDPIDPNEKFHRQPNACNIHNKRITTAYVVENSFKGTCNNDLPSEKISMVC